MSILSRLFLDLFGKFVAELDQLKHNKQIIKDSISFSFVSIYLATEKIREGAANRWSWKTEVKCAKTQNKNEKKYKPIRKSRLVQENNVYRHKIQTRQRKTNTVFFQSIRSSTSNVQIYHHSFITHLSIICSRQSHINQGEGHIAKKILKITNF